MKKNLLYVFITLATLLFTACEQNQLDTQNTISCTPSDTVIAAEGGEFVVAISSSTAWSATTNQKWITISPTSGQGDAYVTIQVAAGEQAEAKVLFATGENTATLTITRGEKQSSDDEEDPSNPNDGKTYPYLTIYDLMPLHLIPLADAEDILIGMGYTAEGVQYHEPLYCYQYTTTNIDTITLLTSVQDGIIEDVHYTASKGINPQAAKEWLMHIPESVTLPVQNQAVDFSRGYAFNDNFDKEVYYYGDWIDLVRDHSYDNIQIGGFWENEAGIETCEHVVSIDYIYHNNTDMVYFGISQIREATLDDGMDSVRNALVGSVDSVRSVCIVTGTTMKIIEYRFLPDSKATRTECIFGDGLQESKSVTYSYHILGFVENNGYQISFIPIDEGEAMDVYFVDNVLIENSGDTITDLYSKCDKLESIVNQLSNTTWYYKDSTLWMDTVLMLDYIRLDTTLSLVFGIVNGKPGIVRIDTIITQDSVFKYSITEAGVRSYDLIELSFNRDPYSFSNTGSYFYEHAEFTKELVKIESASESTYTDYRWGLYYLVTGRRFGIRTISDDEEIVNYAISLFMEPNYDYSGYIMKVNGEAYHLKNK